MRFCNRGGAILSLWLLLALTTFGQSLPAHITANNKTGSYKRQWMGITSVYQATVYVDNRDAVRTAFKKKHPKSTSVDDAANFITDGGNNFTYTLEIKPLLDSRDYGAEKKSLMGMFARIGFEVDENWKLKSNTNHQADIDLYVQHILGRTDDEPGRFYKNRSKGDRIFITVSHGGNGNITYVPLKPTESNKQHTVNFPTDALLRGVILSYISTKHCRPEWKDELPVAMIGYFIK